MGGENGPEITLPESALFKAVRLILLVKTGLETVLKLRSAPLHFWTLIPCSSNSKSAAFSPIT